MKWHDDSVGAPASSSHRGYAPDGPANAYPVTIVESTFLGARNLILVRAGEQEFRVEADGGPSDGDSMVQIPAEACIVFPARA